MMAIRSHRRATPIARMSRGARQSCAIAAAVMALTMSPPRAVAGGTGAPDADPDGIGRIGSTMVRESDIVAANHGEFERLRQGLELQQRQLEVKYQEARHTLLQKQLDQLLDHKALEMEAQARSVAPEAVLTDLKSAEPTEADAHAFYDSNQERINAPYPQVAAKIHDYLTGQARERANRAFYDELRAKHGIAATLGPYRRSVAALGPVRGQSHAAVTIVEFADFQCPYCRQAETSLRDVLAKHPNDVKLVFRNLPLEEIHPNARIAAKAGVCADRQGKFWEMHDAMYGDPSALNTDALKNTAKRLGLNADRFSTCLDDPSTNSSLEADTKAALELGLDGTPSLFINGRPLEGDVPEEKLERMIAEEMVRTNPQPG
jgi:predicted DsbA family dithiol-disulfide isomerase